jgi:anaerobic selenocysteine-containing dehydrogenase
MILPPGSPLERDHYDLVFHALAIRNTAKYSPPLFAPAEGAREDWQIFVDLAARMEARGRGGAWAARARGALLRQLSPRRILDLGLRLGPYGARRDLFQGLSLRRLEDDPHGVDLGALVPCLPERLYTPSRRIELSPALLLADLGRVEAAFPAAGRPGDGDLLLIGRRQLRSNNSWMHNSLRLVKGRDRCTLLMHPEDAAQRGLTNEQRVRVSSRVGCVVLHLTVSDEIMRGVVSIPHGWGHDREGIRLETAARHAGASINDLTDELAIDGLCGNAALSGIPVRVTPANSV